MIKVRMPIPDEILAGLDSRSLRNVAIRAQNKLGQKARTIVRRAPRDRYTVKASAYSKQVRLQRSRYNRAKDRISTAQIVVKGPRIPAIKFRVKPAKPSVRAQRKLRGTEVQITKTGARKAWPGAFTARMPSGHVGIFRRAQRKARRRVEDRRQAITEQVSLAAADMVGQANVWRRVSELVNRERAVIYQRELNFEWSKHKGVVG